MSSYSKGIAAEDRIKGRLQNKGWLVRQSPGSRGPFDLYAMRSGRKMLIQVKSGTASLTSAGRRALRHEARKRGATAVSMHVRGRTIKSKFV